MPVARVELTVRDHIDVVVTVDSSIVEAWTAEEQARYQLLGDVPADKGIPADATRFRIRPMDYIERRAERDATPQRFHPKGADLLQQYIQAMRDAHREQRDAAAAGRAFRAELDDADRKALDQASIASMHAEEDLCARCVVGVYEGCAARLEEWRDVLEVIDQPTLIIHQLAHHIRRISGLGERQGF